MSAACPSEERGSASRSPSAERDGTVGDGSRCSDGERPLLVPRAEGDPDFNLFLVCLDGTTVRFTTAPGSESEAVWSPDGRSVAFVQNHVATVAGERTSTFDLMIVGEEGRGARTLVRESRLLGFPTWAPDGSRVAFSEWITNTQISIVDIGGGRVRQVGRGAAPDWSPDGRHFAFVGFEPGSDQAIFTMRADGSLVRRLTGGEGDDLGPRWSPDGEWIAFHRAMSLEDDDIWRIHPDGQGLERVTSNSEGPLLGPTWISDRVIAYIVYTADGQFVVSVDSGTGRELSRARLPDV
jgi:TolB protein